MSWQNRWVSSVWTEWVWWIHSHVRQPGLGWLNITRAAWEVHFRVSLYKSLWSSRRDTWTTEPSDLTLVTLWSLLSLFVLGALRWWPLQVITCVRSCLLLWFPEQLGRWKNWAFTVFDLSGFLLYCTCSFWVSMDPGWTWIRRPSLTWLCLRSSISDALWLWIQQISWMRWHFLCLPDLADTLKAWLLMGSWYPVTLWQRLPHKKVMRDLSCFRSDLQGLWDITTSETHVVIYYKTFYFFLAISEN